MFKKYFSIISLSVFAFSCDSNKYTHISLNMTPTNLYIADNKAMMTFCAYKELFYKQPTSAAYYYDLKSGDLKSALCDAEVSVSRLIKANVVAFGDNKGNLYFYDTKTNNKINSINIASYLSIGSFSAYDFIRFINIDELTSETHILIHVCVGNKKHIFIVNFPDLSLM